MLTTVTHRIHAIGIVRCIIPNLKIMCRMQAMPKRGAIAFAAPRWVKKADLHLAYDLYGGT
jgi:hypothetical protein